MLSLSLLLAVAVCLVRGNVTVSNVQLPRDQNGGLLLTGEADVLHWNGTYYFYLNNWGGCPGVDCCPTPSGCASCCFHGGAIADPCVYTTNHTVVVYSTRDLTSWTYLGEALPLNARPEPYIEFRPHVVYNRNLNQFVMWFESRTASDGDSEYAVTLSDSPEGPFRTVAATVKLAGPGRVGDFDVFIDDDGTGYHVRTGFVVEELTANYTAGTGRFSTFSTPLSSEAPIMFKHNGSYYVIAGTGCCACRGGSTVYLLRSDSPLGNFEYLGEFASNKSQPFDPHSPYNYVTNSQPTAVFPIFDDAGRIAAQVLLGNQWVSAQDVGHPRNHDLLYWSPLSFTPDGAIEHLQWAPTVQLPTPAWPSQPMVP